MTVGDVTGIHSIRMFACKCHGDGEDPEPFVEQLLRARFWPATFTSPRTVYTFRLMDHWHLDVMQGKKPVYDYWLSLQRRTKIVAKDLVSIAVVAQAALTSNHRRAIRTFCALGVITGTRRLGNRAVRGKVSTNFCLPTDTRDPSPSFAPRVPNPTSICQQIGRPKLRTQNRGLQRAFGRTNILSMPRRCKFVKILAIDACFKAHLKSKRHDPNDRPLNMGGAYFAHYDEFLAYEEKFKTESEVRLFIALFASADWLLVFRSRKAHVPGLTVCTRPRGEGIPSCPASWQLSARGTARSLRKES